MSYFGELRRNIRPLAASTLGAGAGLMLMSYTTTIFGPYLVQEFHWARSQYALIGLSLLPTLFTLPIIGWLTDRVGVRRVALVGALGIPICLTAYSLMNGNFLIYFAISCSILILGSFTSPMVYTRLIAADFQKARGLALTIVTIAPAVLAVGVAPALAHVCDVYGFRVGYRALAGFVLVCGLIAVMLIPKGDPEETSVAVAKKERVRTDWGAIFGNGAFWIIFFAMFLCTLQTPLHSSQMALMLADNHLESGAVAAMISFYSVGTIVGRIFCGLALDRFPTPFVAALSMAAPALGYALLASPVDTTLAISAAMFMVGIAVGSEADLQSFLIARHFPLGIFSTTLSLVYCGVFAAGAIGAIALSVTLKETNSFSLFLAGMAVAVALGSLLFLLLPKRVEAKAS